ncbi:MULTISPECIES: hypothetical protein [unclassified Fusibacter]|uniref:hypothetical protein n=1 Tax=unclassified Fusibacter TaxID=2624464 RepID=UPI0010102C26|nr:MULTISPECIES: hypothetical protein [unclassified Fusibacter]MCK8059221.1 hypothetical protein [Fusibacter sp. A2]NPE21315.1 hypothetical protein [Fusibacter sp. A1]RXV62578.1 hypothetical protein DWB64_05710 [Fusibacter sp. A1]
MNMFTQLASSDMMITISMKDLLLSVFWIFMIVAVGMIIAILFKAYQAVRDFRAIVAENRENINLTLNEVPQITKNVQEVTTEVTHAAKTFRPTVDNIAETSESVTETIKNNNPVNEAIVSAYKTVNNVHKLVDSFSKKHKGKEEAEFDIVAEVIKPKSE